MKMTFPNSFLDCEILQLSFTRSCVPCTFRPLSLVTSYKKGIGDIIVVGRKGLHNGRGIYKHYDYLYEGEWKRDKFHGYGVLSKWAEDLCKKGGEHYIIVYEGYWKDGWPDGKGKLNYDDNCFYDGDWMMGKWHGDGQFWYDDGSYYKGQWFLNTRQGRGFYICGNGDWFDGSWEDDKKSGLGAFFHVNTGQLQLGLWNQEGNCVVSQMFDICLRQSAHKPTPYPIPEIGLLDPDKVLTQEIISYLKQIFESGDLKRSSIPQKIILDKESEESMYLHYGDVARKVIWSRSSKC